MRVAGPVIARRQPPKDRLEAAADAVDTAIDAAVSTVRTAVQTATGNATRRWVDADGPETVAATVTVAKLAAVVATAHVRAAAAALGLRRPPADPGDTAGDGDRR